MYRALKLYEKETVHPLFNKGKQLFYHVVSEPGDKTRYDYFVFYCNYYCNFMFMPSQSTFRFPQKINFHEFLPEDLLNLTPDNPIYKIAVRENCNPATVKECCRTILKIVRGQI